MPEPEEGQSGLQINAAQDGPAATPEPGTRQRRPRRQQEPEVVTGPTFWVSSGVTANLGNFENIKFDIGVSGIPYNATAEEREQILATSQEGIHEVVEFLTNMLIDRAIAAKQARGIVD